MTDSEQLIAQAREIYARAVNCSDLATEGAWVAHETVNGLPPNNYWAVTATRTPTAKGVDPFTVWKAHVNTPAMAGLLTFISTALPQLCDLAEIGLSPPTASPESAPIKPQDEPNLRAQLISEVANEIGGCDAELAGNVRRSDNLYTATAERVVDRVLALLPNPSSRGEREGLRDRIARIISEDECVGMYDAAETVERTWQNSLPTAQRILALLTDPEPVNGELVEAAKVFADRAADMEALPDIGWIMLRYGRDEIATPTTVKSFRRLRTALSRAESLQGKGG